MTQQHALQHFLKLAERGGGHGTQAEKLAAYEIASAMIEHAPALDGLALEGLGAFAHFAADSPRFCREYIELGNQPVDRAASS